MKELDRTTPIWVKVLVPLVGLGGLTTLAIISILLAGLFNAWLGQPLPVLGFEQTFDQPINFPHTKHAAPVSEGGLGMDCTYCHRTVAKASSAHVPAVELCASCHRAVGSPESEDLKKLRMTSGIYEDENTSQVVVDPEMASPINWRRVHRMPDHVRFVHSAHINYLTNNPSAIGNVPEYLDLSGEEKVPASQVCSTCHGDVANMEKDYQVEPLKMGQCVNCHRKNGGPTDCAACHH